MRLRKTADSAHLLVVNTESCGAAFQSSIKSRLTVSLARKSCALGYFTFGHELAHNFGCGHDPGTYSNNIYPGGHGHLIEGGLRTILAYRSAGHTTRVNYYSNPSVLYPPTNTPTGLQQLSNNAAVLRVNRFSMADTGDESGACRDYVTIESEIFSLQIVLIASSRMLQR